MLSELPFHDLANRHPGLTKAISDSMNGRAHHTSRAGRPKSGAAKSVRSVVSRCHAVPNDLRQ